VHASNAVKDEPKNAKEELVRMLIEANRFGFIDLRLDATLALATVQLQYREREGAQTLLKKLEADATIRGFHLIAGGQCQ
jgi:hypothetical protein